MRSVEEQRGSPKLPALRNLVRRTARVALVPAAMRIGIASVTANSNMLLSASSARVESQRMPIPTRFHWMLDRNGFEYPTRA